MRVAYDVEKAAQAIEATEMLLLMQMLLLTQKGRILPNPMMGRPWDG